MQYKGNHLTRCAGFMDASWIRLGITNDDSDILWHTLAYSGILWHTLAYSGIPWHVLAYFGKLWHTLVYSGISNASLETADGAYHCTVGSIWLFLLAPSGALVAIPTYYWSTTTQFFSNTPVLNTGLSLSEPLQLYIRAMMLYKGKTWQDFGILWQTLAYSGILWHTLAYPGMFWHTLANSGILLYTLA